MNKGWLNLGLRQITIASKFAIIIEIKQIKHSILS